MPLTSKSWITTKIDENFQCALACLEEAGSNLNGDGRGGIEMNGMRPIHPGEILREEFLIPYGMSAHALAQALRVPAPRINDIVRERRAITPDTALRLARYFGTTPEFWLNLQQDYDLKLAAETLLETIEREVHPHAA
jgi:addiction module HigA family antidote